MPVQRGAQIWGLFSLLKVGICALRESRIWGIPGKSVYRGVIYRARRDFCADDGLKKSDGFLTMNDVELRHRESMKPRAPALPLHKTKTPLPNMSAPFEDDVPVKNTLQPNPDEVPSTLRLDPSEETELVEKSNGLKTSANALFTSSSYTEAITGYTRAIDTLPSYLDYELAVLKSNISACHVKLGEWKDAVEAATQALDSLERLDPVEVKDKDKGKEGKGPDGKVVETAVVEEVDDQTAERYEALQRSGKSIDDVRKIRIKALLRRAKARSELETWANLQGAQEGPHAPSNSHFHNLDSNRFLTDPQITRCSPRHPRCVLSIARQYRQLSAPCRRNSKPQKKKKWQI
jgi:tetratricopeptide (TPR) repeat protein